MDPDGIDRATVAGCILLSHTTRYGRYRDPSDRTVTARGTDGQGTAAANVRDQLKRCCRCPNVQATGSRHLVDKDGRWETSASKSAAVKETQTMLLDSPSMRSQDTSIADGNLEAVRISPKRKLSRWGYGDGSANDDRRRTDGAWKPFGSAAQSHLLIWRGSEGRWHLWQRPPQPP